MAPPTKITKARVRSQATQTNRSRIFKLPDKVLQALEATMITVEIGSKSWDLPKELLSKHSDYFQKLLKDDSVKHIRLDSDFDYETFPLFAEFILTGAFQEQYGYVNRLSPNLGIPSTNTRGIDCPVKWFEKAYFWAYVLGFRLGANKFMNYVMRALFDFWVLEHDLSPKLDPVAATFVCESWCGRYSLLKDLYYHLLYVYWGDEYGVIHDNEGWLKFFGEHPTLKDKIFLRPEQTSEIRWEESAASRELKLYLIEG